MKLRGAIDAPREGELIYQHGFEVRGWVETDDGRLWHAIVVRSRGDIIGATVLPVQRPDVAAELGLTTANVGFIVRCELAEMMRYEEELEFACEVVDFEGEWHPFQSRRVRLSAIDYRIHSHGTVVSDQEPRVLSRSEVYMSGPPSPIADPICTKLVMEYLQPGETVLDVGCGLGAYRHALVPFGMRWTGCEARPDLVSRMLDDGLEVKLSDGYLPFDDKAFDATICIEVLEHIEGYEAFLSEIARVSRRVAIFSVPNFEAVPIASSMYALPFHMLEPDHKNFFTARSLCALLKRFYRHAETFEYGPLDLLRSHDGLAINNHIFGVAFH